MRLWHKDLIPLLPREQLVALWRELSAIAGAIQKNGTPNHGLVNFVLDYSFDHFISYAYYIRQEMTKRGYHTMDKVWYKITSLDEDGDIIPIEEIYPKKMGKFYLTVCLFNLLEKVDCRIITGEEAKKIMDYTDTYEVTYNA